MNEHTHMCLYRDASVHTHIHTYIYIYTFLEMVLKRRAHLQSVSLFRRMLPPGMVVCAPVA